MSRFYTKKSYRVNPRMRAKTMTRVMLTQMIINIFFYTGEKFKNEKNRKRIKKIKQRKPTEMIIIIIINNDMIEKQTFSIAHLLASTRYIERVSYKKSLSICRNLTKLLLRKKDMPTAKSE